MEDYITIGQMLQIGSGVFWIIAYVLIILKGFQDRTVGMPFAALCANITWEFLYSFVYTLEPVQFTINIIWLLLDCVILFQFLIYYKEHGFGLKKKLIILVGALATALLIHLGVMFEFHDWVGKYSAFGINLMMSILFVRMYLTKGLLGQSLSIAVAKFLGSFMASILFYVLYPKSILLLILYVLIIFYDLLYIVLVQSQTVKVVKKPNLSA